MYRLRDYRFRDIVACSPDNTAFEAAQIMDRNHVGCVLVRSKETGIVGVITRYDLVHSIIAGERDPKNTKVTEVMRPSPVSVNEEASALDALRTMLDNKVSRLVVLSMGGKVMGVLSIEDVIGNIESRSIQGISEKSDQIFDMVKRLTPALVARYDGEEKLEVERDLNNEVKALIRLLEEAEIALRH